MNQMAIMASAHKTNRSTHSLFPLVKRPGPCHGEAFKAKPEEGAKKMQPTPKKILSPQFRLSRHRGAQSATPDDRLLAILNPGTQSTTIKTANTFSIPSPSVEGEGKGLSRRSLQGEAGREGVKNKNAFLPLSHSPRQNRKRGHKQ